MATSVLSRVHAIMDRVYSPYTGPAWKPLAFKGRSRRYLWSDAFGVCNYISLYYAEGKPELLAQADALIQDVHDELGCYRDSQQRLGNASLDAPTLGGLRIGKENEPDDGQYYHYLTKWMFALNRMSIARDDPKYNTWAIQLATTAHKHFVIHGLGGHALRMVWKMSVDLQHTLVTSEGNLDPIDGFVTYRLLQQQSADKSVLQREIADVSGFVTRKLERFSTSDTLDAGEALWLAEWFRDESWAKTVRAAALESIDELFVSGWFDRPATSRLLFREMGTVLGLKTAAASETLERRDRWRARVEHVERFWSDKVFDHDADISPLMYAAALLPGVWLPRP